MKRKMNMETLVKLLTVTIEAERDGDEFKSVTLLHFIHLCNVLFD